MAKKYACRNTINFYSDIRDYSMSSQKDETITTGLIKLNHEDILDEAHMSEGIVSYLTFSGIHDFQRYHGGLRRFAPNESLTFNSGFKTGITCTSAELPDDSTCRFWTGTLKKGESPPVSQKIYSKVIHLMDPFEFMTRSHILSYLPAPDANDRDQLRKHAISRYNQASVDATICYMLSRLGNTGLSPATVDYYETICGIADNYMYRITDDFMTLRNKLWFWSFAENGALLKVEGDSVSQELRSWILAKPAEASLDSSFYEEISLDNSTALPSPEEQEISEGISFSMEELDIGDQIGTQEEEPIKMCHNDSRSTSNGSTSSGSLTDTEAHIEELEDCGGEVFLRCKNIPVLVCFQQAAEGTMDQLLNEVMETESQDSDACGIFGLPECERMWSAWLFQVCTALSVFQRYTNFCHNDLHTNNIVWVSTEEQYLYYKSQNGVYYKVPTYGKIFKLIDFGRATAEIGNIQIISTDYAKDQDAWGQYNWGPIKDESEPEIAPNPSFDLSRLAVSIFETLYPAYDHLTDADESPLAALLWKWLQDDEKKSIMYDEDDIERFPGFDLYVHIAHHVHNAIPAEQFGERAFNQFKWKGKSARSAQVKWWPLFSSNGCPDID